MTDAVPASWEYDEVFDPGDLGCGELLLELRARFRELAPGRRLLVVARDAGAPLEIPAWCRLTGRELLRASHPHYLIRTG